MKVFRYYSKPATLLSQQYLKKHLLHDNISISAKNLHMEYPRTNDGKFSLKAKGSKIWNDLPDDVKNSLSCSTFKRKVKMILFNTLKRTA